MTSRRLGPSELSWIRRQIGGRGRTAALARSGAPLALMGLIFFLSAQPNLSTELGLADLVLRKLAHIVAFGSLTLLWWWALRAATPRALAAAAMIAFLYAVFDEYHQTSVEGRSGSPIDVVIDGVGICLATLLVSRRVPLREWRRRETARKEAG